MPPDVPSPDDQPPDPLDVRLRAADGLLAAIRRLRSDWADSVGDGLAADAARARRLFDAILGEIFRDRR